MGESEAKASACPRASSSRMAEVTVVYSKYAAEEKGAGEEGEAVAEGWCGGEEEPVREGEPPSAARQVTTPDEGVVVLALSSGMTNRG